MKRQTDKGAALISAVLVMMLMSALVVGVVALVVSDQQSLSSTNSQTQAYMGAHAGLEKMTADLGALFKLNYSPTGAQVDALVVTAEKPSLPGLDFTKASGVSGYRISYKKDADGNPALDDPNGSDIKEGPYQGLKGLITPYTMDVTARTSNGAEVRLTREVQSVAIPVFQFGIFSDKDLGFHAGPDFSFGGRVHTNQNLFLAEGSNKTLYMGDRVTAVGEVVRSHLANGQPLSTSGHTGTVRIATQKDGCEPGWTNASCRVLSYVDSNTNHEGSVNIGAGGVPPSTLTQLPDKTFLMVRNAGEQKNAQWTNTLTSYKGYLENGVYRDIGGGKYQLDGGTARRLELPIVDTDTGATAIDLIRRPKAGDATGPGTTHDQRFYALASLRILLSDSPNEIKTLPKIDTSVDPFDLTKYNDTTAGGFLADNAHPALAKSKGLATLPDNTPLVTGFIKIERQKNDGTWHDVTHEILSYGISGKNISLNGVANSPRDPLTGAQCPERNPDAIIRFQRVADAPQDENGTPASAENDNCGKLLTGANPWTTRSYNYIPLSMYDAREGQLTDNDKVGIRLQGVMHYVEFDVNNFRRWIEGTLVGTGNDDTMSVTGYVVYFSDRRGNKDATNKETGELGFEDTVKLNGTLDPGENFNESKVGNVETQELYGNTPHPPAGALGWLANPVPGGGNITNSNLRYVVTGANAVDEARKSPPAFFRRALKIVNGGRGQLPHGQPPNSQVQGLTIASENPAYVEGNYNACGLPTDDCGNLPDVGFNNDVAGGSRHYSSAVIADAVTLLSRKWNDIQSFTQFGAAGSRAAATTWYRLAIISGKGINFPYEVLPSPEADRGSDGGVHNFLRYLEGWNNGSVLNYRGSMVSLYYNRQAVGVFKYGYSGVYTPPDRQYKFDSEFNTPSKLPPRTPMFRDINVLTFRESFIPTNP
jgi:hypothetical protein